LKEALYFTTIHNLKIKAVWENDIVWLSYPVYSLNQYVPEKELMKSLGLSRYLSAGICVELETLFIELENATTLKAINPDYALLIKSNTEIKEVVITSVSDESQYDFMLRSFCPWIGIDEDPVTGSVHSVLAAFWKVRLGKEMLTAYQASSRGGEVFVKSFEERVELGGKSVVVLRGEWISKTS
jgi:PhzF family phenazine biosynthesis protein